MAGRRLTTAIVAALAFGGIIAQAAAQTGTAAASTANLAQSFIAPPADARPMVRWWWFGSAVEPKGIAREIAAMRAGGFGGFEIQPVYALALDDPASGLRNLDYMSPGFLQAVAFANEEGRRQGMRVDITMGSGWPFGGPHVDITEASSQLRLVRIPLPKGAADAALPSIGAGERLITVFVADGVGNTVAGGAAKAVDFDAANPRVKVSAENRDRTLLVFIQSRTGQQLKRPGPGGEGFVLDHLNASAVEEHLKKVGDPLMTAFNGAPPYAIFSDSLEVYGADWTDDFLTEFKKRRGYDLTPRLPALYFDAGPETGAVRRDWARTLSELVDERYLTPVTTWAHQNGTKFRSQTYGIPPVSLSSNRLVDLAEGEGNTWRRFTSTRWASSANHIYGKPVTSAESWTWLHSPAFRATPFDMKVEADLLLLQGVNQFVAHGWPYTPEGQPEPGWAFYAAAVFNDHNPWWPVMPDVTLYLQRLSHLMRQGSPVADVAVFLPTDDAFSHMEPGRASVNEQAREFITDGVTTQILDSGFSFDLVDDQSIETVGLTQKILILPHVTRMPVETYRRIAAFAAKGGVVIAVDRLPDTAPGLKDASQSDDVRAIGAKLFAAGSKNAIKVAEAQLGQTLKASAAADLTGAPADLGFVHRQLANGDVYFVANTSSAPINANLGFRAQQTQAQWWDPRTGEVHAWSSGQPVSLAPYESRVFVFGAAANAPLTRSVAASASVQPLDLSKGWTVRFKNASTGKPANLPMTWDKDADTRFYSGEAAFSRHVKLTGRQIASGQTWLDFGQGTPIAAQPRARQGVALLDAPIREAAEVFVNGKRAGSVWSAPFRINLANYLKAGDNTVEVRVTNTAINSLAGRAPADYRLLNLRYGERFTPQDTANLSPLPSGIVGSVTLQGSR